MGLYLRVSNSLAYTISHLQNFLHWLPVCERIRFKLELLLNKARAIQPTLYFLVPPCNSIKGCSCFRLASVGMYVVFLLHISSLLGALGPQLPVPPFETLDFFMFAIPFANLSFVFSLN